MDVRLGWRPGENLEVAVVGQQVPGHVVEIGPGAVGVIPQHRQHPGVDAAEPVVDATKPAVSQPEAQAVVANPLRAAFFRYQRE